MRKNKYHNLNMDRGQENIIPIPYRSLKLSGEYFSLPSETRNLKTHSKEIPAKHRDVQKYSDVHYFVIGHSKKL